MERHGVRKVLGFFAVAVVVAAGAASNALANEDLLVRAVVDGKQTSLYEKVVVTGAKATLSNEPGVRKQRRSSRSRSSSALRRTAANSKRKDVSASVIPAAIRWAGSASPT